MLVENIIPPGNAPHPGKLSDIQMMLMLGGRERTEVEYGKLFDETGFRLTGVIPTRSSLSIVEAVPR